MAGSARELAQLRPSVVALSVSTCERISKDGRVALLAPKLTYIGSGLGFERVVGSVGGSLLERFLGGDCVSLLHVGAAE